MRYGKDGAVNKYEVYVKSIDAQDRNPKIDDVVIVEQKDVLRNQ